MVHFENAMQNVSSWSERGEAIHGLNANFYVDDEDGPNQNVGLSRFKGFDMAIDVSILNGAYNHMMVRETDFTQNRIGIFNRNVCFQRLIKNNMIVGESTGIAALDDQEIDHEGIVLDGGGFYRVSGNEIIGDQLSAANIGKTIGIRIRDNVTENQEVNNNHLFNCNYAMLPNGNNRTFDSGLRFVCNEFEDNVQDIFVGDFPGNGNLASIAQAQSDLGNLSFPNGDMAAGNSFSSTPPTSNFYNDPNGDIIEYLYFDDAGGPQTPILEGNVTPNNDGAPNSCELETIDEMPVDDVLNPTVISNWTQITERLKETWNTYDYLYTATIDQGNTQALVNLIDGAWSTNVWSVRQTLLNGSPNLSEEVLLKLAFYMPDMPYLMALEIFLANPTITVKPSFNMYLKTETNMPDYMIDLIANNTNQSLSRELLEENVAKSHMRFLEAQTYLLQYNLYHNAMSSLDLIVELDKSKCLTAEWLINDMYLNQDMFQEAHDRYYETSNHLRFSKLEMGQEYYAFGEWLEVVANNSDLTRLGESDLATLENLASTSYFTTAGKKAMTLLNEHYEMDHFTPPYYQSQNARPRSFHFDENGSVAVHLMRVFPNPASQYLQVQCDLSNQFIGNEELVLLDGTGKQIRVMKINQAKQSFVIDLTIYASGQYQLLLKNGDHVLETTAISVEH
jgi:hypothetical protein